MPLYPKPKFANLFTLDVKIGHLSTGKATRGIPNKTNDEFIGPWNIANLGLQKRTRDYYVLIAIRL